MKSIIKWTLGIIVAILVVGVIIGGACTSGFGAWDDNNGKTASVNSDKCPNGNLLANDCQPAPAVDGKKCPNGNLRANDCRPVAKGIDCGQTPNNPLCKSGNGQAQGSGQAQAGAGAPYNIPPQPQIGHPSIYIETGIPDPVSGTSGHTKRWIIDVLQGTVAIIGGFTVDGVTDGVYKAVAGPARLDTTVTDGFLAITKSEWGNSEWCFRIGQAVQYGWDHQHESPMSGWNCAGANAQPQPASGNIGGGEASASSPLPSGDIRNQPDRTSCTQIRGTDYRSTNERGWFLKNCQQAPAAAPAQASVQSAPAAQTQSATACETVNCKPRHGDSFVAGEAVVGFFTINGQSYGGTTGCYMANAPAGGPIKDGIANPWPGEIAGKQAC